MQSAVQASRGALGAARSQRRTRGGAQQREAVVVRCAIAGPAPARLLAVPTLRRQRRAGRRHAVVCRATAKTFYDLLGVQPTASDKDIKSAYRKLAMKLHPDVNKEPDAQKRFMEVKVAYETLSEPRQRAEYDRRLRVGYSGAGSAGFGRAGAGAGAYGSGAGGWGGYGGNPYGGGAGGGGGGYTPEPMPGLDDLIRELEKEFTAWANTRTKSGGKSKTLAEELEDLGGELLDFLEEALGIKDEPSTSSSSANTGSYSRGGSASREPRTAAEKFDALWEAFGDGAAAAAAGAAGAGASGASGSSSRGGAGGPTSASGASAASASSGGPRTSGQASAPPPRPPPPPPPPPPSRSADDDIDAQLLALKKKLNKL